jgi:hypothetical protein
MWSFGHGIEGTYNHLAVDVVRLEHIATHNNERTLVLGGKSPDRAYRFDASLREPGLGLGIEKAARHTELPVCCMDELHHTNIVPEWCAPCQSAATEPIRPLDSPPFWFLSVPCDTFEG